MQISTDWIEEPLLCQDEHGRLLEANQAGCHLLGYHASELSALYAWNLDTGLTRERWLTESETFDRETVMRRKDGSSFPARVRGRRIDRGGQRCVITLVGDMTHLKRLEKEAREAERNVKAILNHIPDIAWMKDAESRFLAINQALARSVKIEAEAAVGLSDYDLVPAELAERYRADDAVVIATAERRCIEEPFIGADGLPRWIETIKTPICDDSGQVVATVGIARDITERKLAEFSQQEMRAMLEKVVEERTRELDSEINIRKAAETALLEKQVFLETVIDGSSAVIFVKDSDGRYVLANRRYLGLWGWRREEVIGKTDFDLYPHALAEQLLANDRAVLSAGAPIEFEETVSSRIGTRTYISLKVPLVTPGASRPFAVCGIATDITERKAELAQLQQARDAAERANRMMGEMNAHLEARIKERTLQLEQATAEAERANLAKSKFLAAASHDLRQPVQAIVLMTEVLKLRTDHTPLASITATIEQSLNSLQLLLGSILDISQLDAGIVLPKIEPVSLGDLLGRLAEEYRLVAGSKGLGLRYVATAATVSSDPALLERAIRNLVENAVKYTPAGTILIGCRRRGPDVRIDVVDTGIGVAAEDSQAIFEEFHQVNNPGRDRALGLGLGLAIVRRSVSLLHGSVEMASVPGRGTRVSILLPREATACHGSVVALEASS